RSSSRAERMRAFISAAAAFVKVATSSLSTSRGRASSAMREMMRSTSTAVLPEPAAAETSSRLPSAATAIHCSSVHGLPAGLGGVRIASPLPLTVLCRIRFAYGTGSALLLPGRFAAGRRVFPPVLPGGSRRFHHAPLFFAVFPLATRMVPVPLQRGVEQANRAEFAMGAGASAVHPVRRNGDASRRDPPADPPDVVPHGAAEQLPPLRSGHPGVI